MPITTGLAPLSRSPGLTSAVCHNKFEIYRRITTLVTLKICKDVCELIDYQYIIISYHYITCKITDLIYRICCWHDIWDCVFSAYLFLFGWLCEYVYLHLIIIIKLEIWIMGHCLGLSHETIVCTVCLPVVCAVCIPLFLIVLFDNKQSFAKYSLIINMFLIKPSCHDQLWKYSKYTCIPHHASI